MICDLCSDAGTLRDGSPCPRCAEIRAGASVPSNTFSAPKVAAWESATQPLSQNRSVALIVLRD